VTQVTGSVVMRVITPIHVNPSYNDEIE
jgi:hypothetical protein